VPQQPANFVELLAKDLAGVSSDASARVAAQLAKHDFHDGGEAWLQQGLKHAADGDCPFCGRALEGLELIKVYEGYFSQAYGAHKLAIDELRSATAQALGEAAALRCVQGFEGAETIAQFWRDYGVEAYSAPAEIDEVVTVLGSLAKEALELIDAKVAAPLEKVAISVAFENALGRWRDVSAALDGANKSMAVANTRIQTVKEASEAADPKIAKAKLDRLLATQARHSEPVATLAAKYAALVKKKADLVSEKSAKKADLDAYDADMLGVYEKAINTILTRFDAGFRLAKCSKNYMGGTPQSAYCLQFGDTDVDVSKTGGGPTFATTMSAGDKNTFALAFFLAQLERDGDLAQKIVVFDDPFTSLDDFRREMTAKAIVRVGEKAAQVIVLSHDKYFLDAVRRKIHGMPWASKQISMTQSNSALEDWDIEWEVKEGYLQDHMELSDFAAGIEGEAKDMRTKMRPLLEKYIRYRFPNQIKDGDWLGDMCGAIRNDPDHPLQPQLAELEDINEYTAPFHHDPNTPFNADEVIAHVKRTLAIVGGC
jgi:wobble nucleotide-excising tRNase